MEYQSNRKRCTINKIKDIDHNNPILVEAYKKVGQLIDEWGKTKSSSICGVFVYGDKIVYSKGIGKARPHDANSENLSIDHNVRIGSITKVFTALAMYHQRDHGILNLNDPLVKYIPDFTILPLPTKNGAADDFNPRHITLGHLASHLSGLPRDIPCRDDYESDKCSLKETLSKVKNMVTSLPVNSVPYYSNLGFALLGAALEKSSKMSIEDYVTQYILRPLGMETDTVFRLSKVRHPLSVGVTLNESGVAIRVKISESIGWTAGMGGLFSTPRSMAKFASYLIKNPGHIINSTTIAESMRPMFLSNTPSIGMASPWEMYYNKNHSIWKITKSGSYEGFISMFTVVNELKIGGYIVALNDQLDIIGLNNKIFDILIPAYKQILCNEATVLEKLLEEMFELNHALDQRFDKVGIYESHDHGHQILNVTLAPPNGNNKQRLFITLVYPPDSTQIPIIPLGPSHPNTYKVENPIFGSLGLPKQLDYFYFQPITTPAPPPPPPPKPTPPPAHPLPKSALATTPPKVPVIPVPPLTKTKYTLFYINTLFTQK
eukprot:gene8033-9881_t